MIFESVIKTFDSITKIFDTVAMTFESKRQDLRRHHHQDLQLR
jgi:hypothetical protein